MPTNQNPAVHGGSINPNPQQLLVVEHFAGPCMVMAVPGSGKTASVTERTRRLLAKGVDPKTILSITFTNKAANEMRERIAKAVGDAACKMTISTFHSLCSKIIRTNCTLLGLDKNYSIYDSDDQERLLKTCILKIEDVGSSAKFKPSKEYISSLMGYIEGIRNACMTEEAAAQKYGIDGNQPKVAREYFDQLRKSNAVDFTGLLSETLRLFKENPAIRDVYRNRFRYISVDEVQDTNIAQYQLIKDLGLGHCNVLVVGDLDQCLPADEKIQMANGSKIEISNIKNGDQVATAFGRGNVGSSKVEDVFEKNYSGDILRITTKSGQIIRATPNHVLFGVVRPLPEKWIVYLMYKAGKGYRIGRTVGSRQESKNQPVAIGIKVRINQEHADKIWILRICDSLEDAAYYEVLYSTRYSIPTICFHANGRRLALSQQRIDQIYNEIDSVSNVRKLMEDLDIFFDYPHLLSGGKESIGRPTITLSMFGHKKIKGNKFSHVVTLHGKSSELGEKLKAAGFSITPSKKDMWRFRCVMSDYSKAAQLAESMKELDKDLVIVRKAVLSPIFTNEQPFLEMPAGQFHIGMSIAINKNGQITEDTVVKIERYYYSGKVYDLKIAQVCNFVTASGIVCHNSIYKFRSANPENILAFEKDFPGCKVLKLEKNYRSTPSILKYSQNLIEHNLLRKGTALTTDNPDGSAPRILAGKTDLEMARIMAEEIAKKINAGTKPKEIAILYRTNYASRVLENAMRNAQIKYKIIGGLSFWDRKEVKAGIAILKMLCNENDRMAFEKVCEACCKGVGDKALGNVAELAQTKNLTILNAAKEFASGPGAGPRRMMPLITSMSSASPIKPGEAMLKIAYETSFWTRLEADSTDTNDRCQNILEMARDVDDYCSKPKCSLAGYLQNLSLITSGDEDQDDELLVKMMTMHGCKGLEFDVVYISHCNEGMLPHRRIATEFIDDSVGLGHAIEEERRLLYVAMTRARKDLTLMFAASKIDARSKDPKPTCPSSFLFETGIQSDDLLKYRYGLDPDEKIDTDNDDF